LHIEQLDVVPDLIPVVCTATPDSPLDDCRFASLKKQFSLFTQAEYVPNSAHTLLFHETALD
jgi:hypothetical protein